MKRIGAWIVSHWRRLHALKDSPHAIALGVASGIFYGFTPLTGLKTLLAIGTAWVFRGSKLAAAIAVTLHDVFLPLMPLLLLWEYRVGYWLMTSPHRMPPSMKFSSHPHLAEWMRWSTFLTVGRPLLLGSLVFAVPAGLIAFFAVKAAMERHRRNTGGV
jgi:uncharacterized protein